MMKITIDGYPFQLDPAIDAIVVDGQTIPVRVVEEGSHFAVYVGDRVFRVELPAEVGPACTVVVDAKAYPVLIEDQARAPAGGARPAPPRRAVGVALPGKGAVVAPVAGRVTRVLVKAGQAVKEGEVLLILEAMKMENELRAPKDGVVKEVAVAEGARVNEGDPLVVIE